jgi:hypothetical protein
VEEIMRTLPVPFLAAALVLALVGTAPAQDDPRLLIEKAVKALGGEERLATRAAVHTRVKSSFVGVGGAALGDAIKVTGETWTQPGSHRMNLVIVLNDKKMTHTTVLHQGQGWQENGGTVTDMLAAELAEAKHSDYVDRVLSLVPLLKGKEFALKPLGKVTVDGAELLGVKVTSLGNRDVTLYFDPATGYPKRAEYREKATALGGKEVATATVFDDYREVEPAATEEAALKAAKVGTDGAALLEFLRGQVRGEADLAKVKGLVKQLGDDDFEVREKATAELIRLGAVALPELRKAAKDADAEVATRATRCLEKIAAVKGPEGLLSAALRLTALRRPAGAAEVLLALAPSLTDEAEARELHNALAAVARRDGKPDKAVEKALDDKDPARRAAAAAALGKDGGAFEKLPGRRLFVSGTKRAMKLTYYQDGEKQLVLEVTDVQLYNRFDDKLFAKPK